MKLKILEKINSIYLIIPFILILNIFAIQTTYSIYSDKEVIDNNTISTASFGFTSDINVVNSIQRSTSSLESYIAETKEFILTIKNTGDLIAKFEVKSIPNSCDNLWLIVKDSSGANIYDGFVKDLKFSIDRLGINKRIEFSFKFMTNSKDIKCDIPIEINGWQEIFDNDDYGYRLKKIKRFQFEIANEVQEKALQNNQINEDIILENPENEINKRELMSEMMSPIY